MQISCSHSTCTHALHRKWFVRGFASNSTSIKLKSTFFIQLPAKHTTWKMIFPLSISDELTFNLEYFQAFIQNEMNYVWLRFLHFFSSHLIASRHIMHVWTHLFSVWFYCILNWTWKYEKRHKKKIPENKRKYNFTEIVKTFEFSMQLTVWNKRIQ